MTDKQLVEEYATEALRQREIIRGLQADLVREREAQETTVNGAPALVHSDANRWHWLTDPCNAIHLDGTTECGWLTANPEPEPAEAQS